MKAEVNSRPQKSMDMYSLREKQQLSSFGHLVMKGERALLEDTSDSKNWKKLFFKCHIFWLAYVSIPDIAGIP